jgi:hypothetical protein
VVRTGFTLFVGIAALILILQFAGVDDDQDRSASAPTATTIPTQTPVPTKTPDELQAEADYLDPRLLTSNAEGHVGENIFVQGYAQSVEQSGEYTWIHLLAKVRDRPVEESAVVELRPPEPNLLSDECYRFFGIVGGTTETKIVLTGATNTAPLIEAYAYEPSERSGESSCEAP